MLLSSQIELLLRLLLLISAVKTYSIGYYSSNLAQNLTSSVGKTIYLNCSLYTAPQHSSSDHLFDIFDYSKYVPSHRSSSLDQTTPTTTTTTVVNELFAAALGFNPTWLKADYVYNQNGVIEAYRTENIIVTRKGVIADALRDKVKLIQPATSPNGDRMQVLKLSDLEVRDEGKYICRELSANIDRAFYLNVFSPIRELSLKFYSPSKYFREIFTNNREAFDSMGGEGGDRDRDESMMTNTANRQYYSSNTVSIKEGDELLITCTVNSSKPAAILSLWVLKRQQQHHSRSRRRRRRRGIDSSTSNDNVVGRKRFDDNNVDNDDDDDDFDANDDSRKLEIIDSYVIKNNDLTLKSVSSSKFVVSRTDNHRFVACMAENPSLNEKWETKRILNVLYGPKCSKYQKTVYNTGINQTIDLECHMTEANPPYLDFTWSLLQQSPLGSASGSSSAAAAAAMKERTRTTGFISRISYTPRSLKDFGDIACRASNGLDPVGGSGECKMRVELGGAPEPPTDCYHKENNRTIIIECKPGFDQGDPEVYFYLLKRKSNGVLVEYARKRDSCSFLISNLILEEYSNDFFIYSSNKYGTNRERAAKLTIENREMLNKNGMNSEEWDEMQAKASKKLTYLICTAFVFALVFLIVCCLLMRCKRGSSHRNHHEKRYSSDSMYNNNTNGQQQQPHVHFQYSAPATRTSTAVTTTKFYNGTIANGSVKLNGNLLDEKKMMNEKEEYFDGSADDSSSSNNDHYEKEDYTGVYDNNSYKRSYSKLNEQNIRSPSLINNIQDLDSSPKSKRKSMEKTKEQFGYSRSLIDETTETDSENYVEFNRTKIKEDNLFEPLNVDENEKFNFLSQKFQLSNKPPQPQQFNSYGLPKVNIWASYNSNNKPKPTHNHAHRHSDESAESPENDNYSGISVDTKPIVSTSINKNKWSATTTSEYRCFRSSQLPPQQPPLPPQQTFKPVGTTNITKHHSPPSINEYIDEDQVEEASSDSTTNTGTNSDTNTASMFKWPKTKQLISNETISMDVDDEKVEGILV